MNPDIRAIIDNPQNYGVKVRTICHVELALESGPMMVECHLYPACYPCGHEVCYRTEVIELPRRAFVEGRCLEE